MAQQVLNIEYQDMKPEVLEFAKNVSDCVDSVRKYLSNANSARLFQLILATFEAHREEKVIANKIRLEFDKQHGKLLGARFFFLIM